MSSTKDREPKHMGLSDFRRSLGVVVRRIHTTGSPIVLERDDLPLAAVVSYADFLEWQKATAPITPTKP